MELEHINSKTGSLNGFELSGNLSSTKNAFTKGSILFGKLRPYLRKFWLADRDGACSSEIWVLNSTQPEYLLNAYLFYLIQTDVFMNEANKSAGSKMPRAEWSIVSKKEFHIPSISEQRKISNLFSLIDQKIQKQQYKVEQLEIIKVGMLQKIFSQELRFRDKNGEVFADWEKKQLSNLLFEHKVRNCDDFYSKEDVLSVSGEHGIVNQVGLLGRSFAGASVTNYHVVHRGDVVYTKSPLKRNPYGIIKVNKGKAGIVSTLYAVYSCKQGVSGEYLDYYFQLDENTNRYLKPLVNKGAKNDMKVNNQQVLVGSILVPTFEEQLKIVRFLNLFDKKIEYEKQKLEMFKNQKMGFIQHMFV